MITVTPAMIVFLAQGQTQLYMCSVFGQGPSRRQISTTTISTLVPLRSTNEPDSKSDRLFAMHRSSPRLQPRPLSREIHRLARQGGQRGELTRRFGERFSPAYRRDQGADVRAVAIGTLRRRLFVDDHRLGVDHARLLMAFVASHACVPTLQGKMRPGVMVEGGGHPALRIVAVRTRRLPDLGELAVMGIFVTIFADLRRVLELYFLFAERHLVTITALGGAMRSEQREFGFRMVEAFHVRPGPYVMAGFASLRCAVSTASRHAFFEFAVMDIFMAGGAGPIFEMERQDFI